MTPFWIVLIAGVIAHTIVGVATRTPEEDRTPLRWKAWHSLILGITSSAFLVTLCVLTSILAGTMPPFWALLLALDVSTLGWKLHRHRQRLQERRTLQSLMDRPAYGDPA